MSNALAVPTSTAGTVESPAARRGTLLIVDDEEGPRQALRILFKDDYNLLLAPDGYTAVELSQKNRVDVAVLDIRMSGMSGIELLERLKYVDPAIEVVMMTAFETTDTLRQALRLRAADYINKPFDIATMRAAVANAFSRRMLSREINNNAAEVQELLGEFQNLKVDEQLSRIRGDIYASVFHDLKNSLTVIAGFGQLVTQRLGNGDSVGADDLEFVRKHLQTINRQVTGCIELSRRYLAYLSRQPGETPQVSVNQVVADLKELVDFHPSVEGHEFAVHPLPEDAQVRINGTDLIQVLLNLAVNAFQCTPQKHRVEIEARLLPQPLDLKAFKDSSQERILNLECFENTAPILSVAVKDNGPGVPPEVLPQMFNPYFTTKCSGKGTGLGLNIVQRLVKRANGVTHVRTSLGEGTTFTVYLPAVGSPSPSSAA